MKSVFSLIVACVLFTLSSCQKPYDEVLSSTDSKNSARMSASSSTSSDPDEMTEAQWLNEGYDRTIEASNLPTDVRFVYNNYLSSLSQIESIADNQSDHEIMTLISNAAIAARNQAQTMLSGSDRDNAVEAFQGTADYSWWAFDKVSNNAWDPYAPMLTQRLSKDSTGVEASSFLFGRGKKFWRAVLRVVVAVAVTALVVSVAVVAAAALGPIGSMAMVKLGPGVATALVKGFTLGSFKATAALATGAAAGLKNAEKNWDKPWQGSVEFMFGIKLKPVYH